LKITLIAVGTKMDSWVEQGYNEYARRMPKECSLQLIEIGMERRGKSGSPERWMSQEGERILAAVPKGDSIVALDVKGSSWSTEKLADQMRRWMDGGRGISLLVGGPDGLAGKCIKQAEQRWSLSNLTLPHPLVRVVLSEQLYRAWSVVSNHPYHRA
jgi:23S rRNA (pseudouridine1915-N3)-methyltransferase